MRRYVVYRNKSYIWYGVKERQKVWHVEITPPGKHLLNTIFSKYIMQS